MDYRIPSLIIAAAGTLLPALTSAYALPAEGDYLGASEIPMQPMQTMQTMHLSFPEWPCLTAQELAEARGGFALDDDLDGLDEGFDGKVTIDFGFEALVMVDGILQAQTRLYIPGLGAAHIDPDTLEMVRLGHIDGALRPVDSGAEGFSLHTVIQNDLDQKTIQSLRVLNIQVHHLGQGYGGTVSRSISQQLIQSLR